MQLSFQVAALLVPHPIALVSISYRGRRGGGEPFFLLGSECRVSALAVADSTETGASQVKPLPGDCNRCHRSSPSGDIDWVLRTF